MTFADHQSFPLTISHCWENCLVTWVFYWGAGCKSYFWLSPTSSNQWATAIFLFILLWRLRWKKISWFWKAVPWRVFVWSCVFVCGVNVSFCFVCLFVFTDVQANRINAPVSAGGKQGHHFTAEKIFNNTQLWLYVELIWRWVSHSFSFFFPFSMLIFLFAFFSCKFRCECMQKAKAKSIYVWPKKQQNNALLSLATYHITKRKCHK